MWTSVLAAIVAFFKALPKILELVDYLKNKYDKYQTERQQRIADSRKDTKDKFVDDSIDGMRNNETTIEQQQETHKPR
jgi:hypothetical protein